MNDAASTLPYAGVIFDMDGVLCDSEPFICEAGCRMFQQVHGKTVAPEDFEPFVGMGEDRYLGGVAEKHGVTLTMPQDKVETYRIYLKIIIGRLRPLAGVHDFVAQVRQAGCKTAVASSADLMKVQGNLKEIDLPPEKFDAVITGDDVEHKKPAPDIFLLAAERMGVAPEKCLVVEDAPSGIAAGVAAGCKTLGILSSFDAATLQGQGADWVADDLASVPGEVFA